MVVGDDLVELLHRDRESTAARWSAPRQACTAAAEAEMAARLAREVVDVGIGILPVVAIARAVGEADEIAGAHRLAVQLDVSGQAAAEALRRGVVAQRFLHRVGQQRRVGDHRAARVGESRRGSVPNIDMKPPSNSTPAMISVVVVSSTSRSSSLSPSISAEREMRDEVVLRFGAPLGDHLRRVVLHPFVGGDVLGPLGAGDAGRDWHHHHRVLAHRRFVAERQAERGEQHPDGELGAEVVDEVEALAAAQRFGRLARAMSRIGPVERRRGCA